MANECLGVYLMSNLQLCLQGVKKISEIKLEIEKDTTNIQVGIMYNCDENKKLLALKNVDEITEKDYITFYEQSSFDLRQKVDEMMGIYNINSEQMLEILDHSILSIRDYLLTQNFIKLGYYPALDENVIYRLVKTSPFIDALNEKAKLTPLFD